MASESATLAVVLWTSFLISGLKSELLSPVGACTTCFACLGSLPLEGLGASRSAKFWFSSGVAWCIKVVPWLQGGEQPLGSSVISVSWGLASGFWACAFGGGCIPKGSGQNLEDCCLARLTHSSLSSRGC